DLVPKRVDDNRHAIENFCATTADTSPPGDRFRQRMSRARHRGTRHRAATRRADGAAMNHQGASPARTPLKREAGHLGARALAGVREAPLSVADLVHGVALLDDLVAGRAPLLHVALRLLSRARLRAA